MIVFITGARGFLGRHLAKKLADLDHSVVGLGNGRWDENEFSFWGLTAWLEGNIIEDNLSKLSDKHGKPDVIFHLAGGSSVGPSIELPKKDFEKSVISAVNVCEWIRTVSPSTKAILASSAAVYGAGHNSLISEDSNLMPYSPYGSHKRICELVFESYAKNFRLNAGIVRYFSIYGPELRKQLLWDICMRLSGDPRILSLGGNGNELRDWLHIDDACQLLHLLYLKADSSCPIINGGTGIATSVSKIADTMIDFWGANTSVAFTGNSRPGDPYSLIADISKSTSFGFTSSKNVTAGLSEYVTWFKQELKNK